VKVEEKEKKGTEKKQRDRGRETEREIERQRERNETHWHSQLDRRRVKRCDELSLRFIFAELYIFISGTAISETPSPLLLRRW
jgi:hypothetical protein